MQQSAITYLDLKKINVNGQTEKKGKFTYLSWTWAVDQLLSADPTASWEYLEPKAFGDTLMVFCTVNAFGKSMTGQLPVMNSQNKAISNPDAMAVNTAMQRCLAKAIALHGLGLYIYAGEDLPDVTKSVSECKRDLELAARRGGHDAMRLVWKEIDPDTRLLLKDYLEALKAPKVEVEVKEVEATVTLGPMGPQDVED